VGGGGSGDRVWGSDDCCIEDRTRPKRTLPSAKIPHLPGPRLVRRHGREAAGDVEDLHWGRGHLLLLLTAVTCCCVAAAVAVGLGDVAGGRLSDGGGGGGGARCRTRRRRVLLLFATRPCNA
jgi:hypothetical protein